MKSWHKIKPFVVFGAIVGLLFTLGFISLVLMGNINKKYEITMILISCVFFVLAFVFLIILAFRLWRVIFVIPKQNINTLNGLRNSLFIATIILLIDSLLIFIAGSSFIIIMTNSGKVSTIGIILAVLIVGIWDSINFLLIKRTYINYRINFEKGVLND